MGCVCRQFGGSVSQLLTGIEWPDNFHHRPMLRTTDCGFAGPESTFLILGIGTSEESGRLFAEKGRTHLTS